MGLGKFLFGGLCAVGAVIAAPVALPAAAVTLAGAGAVGAGVAVASASTATVATVAGVAGLTVANKVEKNQKEKISEAKKEGRKEGVKETSKKYEAKLKDLREKFEKQIEELENQYKASLNFKDLKIQNLVLELIKKKEECEDLSDLNKEKDALLSGCIDIINALENKADKNQADKERLSYYNELKGIVNAIDIDEIGETEIECV